MLWECAGCSTRYAVGLPCCPNCGGTERSDEMAKATEHGATVYVPEGQEVPADLPEGVRPVGPGAPVPDDAEPDAGQEESGKGSTKGGKPKAAKDDSGLRTSRGQL